MPPEPVGLPPIIVEEPAQTATSMPASAVGFGFTVTVAASVPSQPFASVTVTVYSVVAAGDAVGFASVGSSRPAAGDQLYVYGGVPPEPVGLPPIAVDEPSQIATSMPASATGLGFTVNVNERMYLRPEVRGRYIDEGSDVDFETTLSIGFAFGGRG